jgi:DNA (cytosine-5)-methyltransferase 1
VVDLFCGCGGLSLGAFEAARANNRALKIVHALDLDPHAIGIYRENFGVGPTTAQVGDILEVFGGDLLDPKLAAEEKARKACGKVDLIIAGPPCQGHSDLNNSSRRDDPRNSLYLRVVRAANVLQPKAVLIENVPAVVHDRGGVVARATDTLEGLGFSVGSTIVGAATLGLAQTRRRHILIAVRGTKMDFGFLDTLKVAKARTVREYIGDLAALNGEAVPLFDEASQMTQVNKERAEYLYKNDEFDLPNRLRPECHRSGGHSYISMYGRLRWDRPAQTITGGFGSMGQGRFLHPSRCRTITPHEAARLQGFPDFFDFGKITSRVTLQTTIGNAVPPKLGAVFIDRLLKEGYL